MAKLRITYWQGVGLAPGTWKGNSPTTTKPDGVTPWLIPEMDMMTNYPSPVQLVVPTTPTPLVSMTEDFSPI